MFCIFLKVTVKGKRPNSDYPNLYFFYGIKSYIQSPNRQHINLIQTIFTTNSARALLRGAVDQLSRTLDEPVLWLDDRTLTLTATCTDAQNPAAVHLSSLFFCWGPSVLRRSKHTTIKRVSWSLTTRAGRRRGLLGLVNKKQESEQTRGCFAYYFFVVDTWIWGHTKKRERASGRKCFAV